MIPGRNSHDFTSASCHELRKVNIHSRQQLHYRWLLLKLEKLRRRTLHRYEP
jgi:hypothetical protein